MSGRFRIIILAIVGFVIVVGGFAYLSFFNTKKYNTDIVYRALPTDAFLFYSGSDVIGHIKQLKSSELVQNLEANNQVRKLLKDFDQIDSSIRSSNLNETFLNSNKIVSFHKTSINKAHVLALISIDKKISAENIEKLISKKKGVSKSTRTFQGKEIADFQFNQKESLMAYAVIDNLLIISKSPMLVEDAIRTYQKNNHNEKLKNLISQNKLKNKWVVDYSQLGSIANMFVTTEFAGFFEKVDFDHYGIYDLNIGKNDIALRGNISFADSLIGKLGLIQNQKAKKAEFAKIVSNKTSFLVGYNISNYQSYYKSYNQNFVDEVKKANYEKTHSIDLQNDIVPLIFGPYVYAVSEPIGSDLVSSASLVFKVFETDKSIQIFNNPELGFSYTDSIQTELDFDYRGHKIFTSKLGGVFDFIFNSLITFEEEVYFTNIRDYLIFSNNDQVIRRTIDDYVSQQTLSTSASFYKFSEKLSSRSNFLLYVNPSRSLKIPELVLKADKQKQFALNRNVYKNYSAFAFQFSLDNRSIYNEVVLNYNPQYFRQKEYLWEVDLDTIIASEPFVVENHNNGSKEIVVFDAKGNMYLINSAGKTLWKRKLDSPIKGLLHQVDLYNNKKLQYLFSTNNNLYLIDRLGRNVANYPIRLSATTTTGIAAYDMRKNNKHKYYVGTSNNYIFGYNEAAKPLNGWNPVKTKGNLLFPLKYFIKNNSTYILGTTSEGYFYLWNLNAGNVIKPVKLGSILTNQVQMQFESDFNKSHLISVDTTGRTFFIYLSGEVEIKEYGKWSKNVDFQYLDINGDGEKELLFAENNSVLGYSHNGQIVFSTNLGAGINSKPTYLKMNDKYYIAYINKNFGQLFLVDFDGDVNPNFPVDCNQTFRFVDLDKDGDYEVVGGNDNKLFVTRF